MNELLKIINENGFSLSVETKKLSLEPSHFSEDEAFVVNNRGDVVGVIEWNEDLQRWVRAN